MITVPGHGRITLVQAFDLLREMDYHAGHRSPGTTACVEKARKMLAEYIGASLAKRDASAGRKR